MKVLLVSEDVPHPSMGGLGKHVLLLMRALAEAGHTVDLMGNADHPALEATFRCEMPGAVFYEMSGARAGWKEHSLGCFNPLRRAVLSRRFARSILKHSSNYDVIHYHGHFPDIGAFIPDSVNFVQTRHDQGADCLKHTRFREGEICNSIDPVDCAGCAARSPNVVQRVISSTSVLQHRRRVQRAFRSHKTVFVSDMLRRNLCRSFGGAPDDWGCVIHNFADVPKLQSIQPAARPDDGGRLVFVAGKLSPEKGVGAFLESMDGCTPPDMRILIAGDGPEEHRLRAVYANERIEFLGWCDYERTIAHAKRADLVVIPSLWEEPCATTVLEALALGKLTFALARGGTPELGRYGSDPAQLRLFDTMRALASALVREVPGSTVPPVPNSAMDVREALPALIALYVRPLASPGGDR